jgi:formylglycine-generating enzyme required for sulfatase activity
MDHRDGTNSVTGAEPCILSQSSTDLAAALRHGDLARDASQTTSLPRSGALRASISGSFRGLCCILGMAIAAAPIALAAPTALVQTACSADLDRDGMVGAPDLAVLLGAWGPSADSIADLDQSGAVDAEDLSALLAFWGSTCDALSWATVIEEAPDPAIVTSASLRRAIIATGYPWRVRDNLTQIEMVLIPPGEFEMGCSPSMDFACGSDESPVHAVMLTTAFYMGRYEVTQAQWTARMGSNPSAFQAASAEVPAKQVPNRPVDQVSWDMIQGFLSTTEMRLPTEAEWEYACRAGTTTAFHGRPDEADGTDDDAQMETIAWFGANSNGQTHPVGGKAPNGFGLHDMAGNVWEWVNDWYSGSYYASSPAADPLGPATGSGRVLRGGGWVNHTNNLRSSYRNNLSPDFAVINFGFRVVRSVDVPPES